MIYHLFSALPIMVCLVMVMQLALTYRQRTTKAIRWLLLWSIAAFILYSCHFIYFNHYSHLVPVSDTIYVMMNLSVYPLFLYYISAITDRTPLFLQKGFLWTTISIPLLAGITVGSLYSAMTAEEIQGFINIYLYRGFDGSLSGLALAQAVVHIICHIIFAIQVVMVIVKGFRRIKRFNKTIQQLYADTENKEIDKIPTILILFIVTSLASSIANIVGRQIFVDSIIIGIPALAFSALIFALSWVGMKQDFTIQDIPEEQEKETEQNESAPVIPNSHSVDIYQNLEAMMSEQEIFLRNDLKLNDVAKLLGTNRTYLLQALNSCAHMTFKEYINRKRIARAEELIAANPKTPKTEIAVLSGYNSMSSFYRNFALYHTEDIPQT